MVPRPDLPLVLEYSHTGELGQGSLLPLLVISSQRQWNELKSLLSTGRRWLMKFKDRSLHEDNVDYISSSAFIGNLCLEKSLSGPQCLQWDSQICLCNTVKRNWQPCLELLCSFKVCTFIIPECCKLQRSVDRAGTWVIAHFIYAHIGSVPTVSTFNLGLILGTISFLFNESLMHICLCIDIFKAFSVGKFWSACLALN